MNSQAGLVQPPQAPLLEVRNLHKYYARGSIEAVRGVSFRLAAGEIVALIGKSGCGKSTLLNLIAALDRPTQGEIAIHGQSLATMGPIHRYRAQTIGMVFQFHHLLPAMTLVENVEAALVATRRSKRKRREDALSFLRRVGLAHRAHALPRHVSGGERQRAAVVRALVHQPDLLLADEPTGNLDSVTGGALMEIVFAEVRQRGCAALIATHQLDVAQRCDRQLVLQDGCLIAA